MSALSPTRLFTCTACGAVLPVDEEHLGKKCRCGRCGKVSVVAEDSPRRVKYVASSKRPIYFSCRVCDTRLAARVKDVGRKAKCPDCFARTEVPPPPEPREPKVPRAMHGQQYGLWEVDEAPDPAEIAARQPKYFPVYCRVCDTLMHARPEQIGKKLACPDCGAKTAVKEPPQSKPQKSVLVPDGQEYQLDGVHLPPVRPELQFEPPRSAGESRENNLVTEPIRQERQRRPKPPLLPTFQGVLPMLFRNPVVTWFVWLGGMGLLGSGLMMVVVRINPIAAIPSFFGAGLSSLLGLGALSALCLSILSESSEGNDRLYQPPEFVPLDWMGNLLHLVLLGILAAIPTGLLSRALEQHITTKQQLVIFVVGWLFTFPLLLLSSLERGSALEPFSTKIFGSVTKRPAHWLVLVLESAALVGCAAYAIDQLLAKSLVLMLATIPLAIATMLLYFRVLGRFAWWLAESLPTSD